MTRQVAITPDLILTTDTWWAREGPGGTRKHGIRISEGNGWAFIADDEILPLANALANHLANTNNNA